MADLRKRGPNGLHGALNLLTAGEASRRLASGAITSIELVEDCLTRIAAREPEVRAWAHLEPAAALAQARLRDGEERRSPLHGVPVGIKDILDTLDMPTAYGSSIYSGYQPPTDTAVVGLLRRAGAIILGKCVTTEFASPVPKGTRNPHDLTRSPGVSSSGSAAAVADYMVPLSVGSQTGGSTILPASFCGVVGYKASLTGLDRGGIRHLRPTLDTLGLFARSVEDIELMRGVLAGQVAAMADAAMPLSGKLRVGVCRTIVWSEAAPEARDGLETAARRLANAGASVAEAQMPPVFEGIERTFRAISSFEGSRALAAEMRDHLPALNHWIRAGHAQSLGTTLADYDRAQLHAIRCQRALAEVFHECDVLITPAACGEAVADLVSVSNSAFNRIWTVMHVPCVSLPVHAGPNGMPVGLQIVGPAGSDERTLAIARWIEARLG